MLDLGSEELVSEVGCTGSVVSGWQMELEVGEYDGIRVPNRRMYAVCIMLDEKGWNEMSILTKDPNEQNLTLTLTNTLTLTLTLTTHPHLPHHPHSHPSSAPPPSS